MISDKEFFNIKVDSYIEAYLNFDGEITNWKEDRLTEQFIKLQVAAVPIIDGIHIPMPFIYLFTPSKFGGDKCDKYRYSLIKNKFNLSENFTIDCNIAAIASFSIKRIIVTLTETSGHFCVGPCKSFHHLVEANLQNSQFMCFSCRSSVPWKFKELSIKEI